MGIVSAVVMSAFLGARKAQGMAVGTETLKYEGQRTMHQILVELGQARKLIANDLNDPAELDKGLDYFKALDGTGGTIAPLPDKFMDFPRIHSDGRYNNVGTADGQLPHTAFGNALIFVKRDSELPISGVTIKFGSTLSDKLLTKEKPFRLYVYRFVAYYIGQRPLPANARPIHPGWKRSLTLMRYESVPYLEKSEAWGFMSRIPDKETRGKVWAKQLGKTVGGEAIAGAWDSGESAPDKAFYEYSIDVDDMVNMKGIVKAKRNRPLTVFTAEPYALGTVSFNAGSLYEDFKVMGQQNGQPSFVVPAFAVDPTTTSDTPYGFEVGITGPNSGRAIFLRLALATRVSSTQNVYGHIHQEIVQVFDN